MCTLYSNTCARTQIPLFHLSGNIIAKLGVKACIALAQAAYVLRFLNYTVLTDPVWVLPSEVLHGFTFAIMYCAMVSALPYHYACSVLATSCVLHVSVLC
jgi:MFS_1 like family